MNRKNIFLVFVVVLGLVSSLGCSDSDDNSETAVEAEDIQTGEAKAVQEEEPIPASTEETEVITETPASDDTEESKTVTLEEAKAEETPVKDEKEDLEEEYRARLAEQKEGAEEESDEESATSSVSSDDAIWIDVMLDDLADVRADMDDVSAAANNNDMSSLSVYTDNLYSSTNTAIDHCDMYDVSADLQPVEDEYRLAMVAYNWAAVSCYAGIEAYNAGDDAEFSANFENAVDFINSGTDHTLKATDLMNEYNENHGV